MPVPRLFGVPLFLILSAAGLLTACASTPPPDKQARTVRFVCDRGQSIQLTFAADRAELVTVAGSVQIRQQPAGSGIHYAGGGHDLRGKGPKLTWTDPNGTALNCRDQEWAMRQPQIQEPLGTLAGTSWRLVHFQSSDDAIGTVVPPRVELYTLTFNDDGSLPMRLDCNRGMARWEASPTSARGGLLEVSPGAMTRAMCGEGSMDSRIARDMSRVRSFTLADGRLHLALEADGGIYSWEPLANGG